MEPKDFLVYSCLLLLSNGLDSVVSVPYPEYYDGHHGGGHNAIVDYYVSHIRINRVTHVIMSFFFFASLI